MSRDEIKSALRSRIVELRQLAEIYRGRDKHLAREYDARALENERTLNLFGGF